MQRPIRQVRSHPFPCSDAGALPRPKAKLHLAGRPCPGLSPAQSLPLPTHPVSDVKPHVVSIASGVVDCRSGDGSLRSLEDAERRRLACIWLGFAKAVACDSNLRESLESATDAALLPLFLDRAPATLKRHLGGWRLWIGFCASQGWRTGSPSLSQVLDFTVSLIEGCKSNRGRGRRRSAVSCLSGMSFAAYKFQLKVLLDRLSSPLIRAWKDHGKWTLPAVKEAVPFSLQLVQCFEQACVSCNVDPHDQLLLASFLLMCWGGLRFSDAQRLDLRSVVCSEDSIRGRCWRTKSSPRGMCWGFLRRGCLARDWGGVFFKLIADVRGKYPRRDFLLAAKGRPMTYTQCLAHLRRCLVVFGGLDQPSAAVFTLHSLKTTILCWGLQLNLPETDRGAQGHHRYPAPGVSKCVPRYGRDDIEPQLRCQRQVLDAVDRRWVPNVPVDRGLHFLQLETTCSAPATPVVPPPVTQEALSPVVAANLTDSLEVESDAPTEPESESDADSTFSSDASAVESVASTDSLEGAGASEISFSGPWLLNIRSGKISQGQSQCEGGLPHACVPSADGAARWL